MNMVKKPTRSNNINETALRYLSFRNRTVAEMKKYLKEKGFLTQEIDEMVDSLKECSILSDEKYCADYVHFGMEKRRGPLRLERELREKGIELELIRSEIEEAFCEGREREIASELAEKLITPGLSDPERMQKELARVARRLEGQGFHSSVIWDVIRHSDEF
jgi:regulatory protein